MRWNLRLTAPKRDIWKASDLQRALAEHGLVISPGKMSGLWSGQPSSLKLEDLDVICVVLDCQIGDLLIPEPDRVTRPTRADAPHATAQASTGATPTGATPTGATPTGATPTGATPTGAVVLRHRDGRSLPPG